jgi:hypothetical protein
MSESVIPDIWVCRVCRIGVQSIDTRNEDGTLTRQGWLHARPIEDEHAPEPVELKDLPGAEIRTVCDVCCTPNPENEWNTVEHEFRRPAGQGSLTFRDRGSMWLVCDLCLPMVQTDNLVGLVKRRVKVASEIWPRRSLTANERLFVADRVKDFLETRIGEPRPRSF